MSWARRRPGPSTDARRVLGLCSSTTWRGRHTSGVRDPPGTRSGAFRTRPPRWATAFWFRLSIVPVRARHPPVRRSTVEQGGGGRARRGSCLRDRMLQLLGVGLAGVLRHRSPCRAETRHNPEPRRPADGNWGRTAPPRPRPTSSPPRHGRTDVGGRPRAPGPAAGRSPADSGRRLRRRGPRTPAARWIDAHPRSNRVARPLRPLGPGGVNPGRGGGREPRTPLLRLLVPPRGLVRPRHTRDPATSQPWAGALAAEHPRQETITSTAAFRQTHVVAHHAAPRRRACTKNRGPDDDPELFLDHRGRRHGGSTGVVH